jgi:hypothetical protein
VAGYSRAQISTIREFVPELQAKRMHFREAAHRINQIIDRPVTPGGLHSYVVRMGFYQPEPRQLALIAQFFDGLEQCYDRDTQCGGK